MQAVKILKTAFLLVAICVNGFAQDSFFSFVDAAISPVKSNSKSPCILLGPLENHFIYINASIKSDSSALIDQEYYFFFMENKKPGMMTFLKTIETKGTGMYSSEPLTIKDDSIFTWLKNNFGQLQSEYILPYIFEDSVNNIKFYDKGFKMHSFPFHCIVYFGGNHISVEFEDVDMEEKLIPGYPDFHPNVNYRFNSQTKTFKLYQWLKQTVSANWENFVFD